MWDREPKENWKKSGRQSEEKENWKKKNQTKLDKGSEDRSSAILMGGTVEKRKEVRTDKR